MAISPGFTPVGNEYHPLCCARNAGDQMDPVFPFFFSLCATAVAGKNLQNLFGRLRSASIEIEDIERFFTLKNAVSFKSWQFVVTVRFDGFDANLFVKLFVIGHRATRPIQDSALYLRDQILDFLVYPSLSFAR